MTIPYSKSSTIHIGYNSLKCENGDCFVCKTRNRCFREKIGSVFDSKPTNEIRTTNYTILAFLPMVLFSLFKRKANIYFLLISCLNFTRFSSRSPIFALFPLACVLSVSFTKEIYQFWMRRKEDKIENSLISLKYNINDEKWEKVKREDIHVGDILVVHKNEDFPADLLLVQSSISTGICSIKTTNLDGETNLKIKKSFDVNFFDYKKNFENFKIEKNFSAYIETEPPNARMDKKGWSASIVYRTKNENKNNFKNGVKNEEKIQNGQKNEEFRKIPLNMDNLLLRGSVLKNTDWVIAICIFIGKNSKYQQQSFKKVKVRKSILEKRLEKLITLIFVLEIILIGIGCVMNYFFFKTKNIWYLAPNSLKKYDYFANAFSVLFIIETLIPISLYNVIEISKIVHAYIINNDMDMFDRQNNQFSKTRNLNIIENLGKVKIIFTDKTGTLTRNKMVFTKASINGEIFKIDGNFKCEKLQYLLNQKETKYNEFLTLLAVCHTAIIEKENCNLLHEHLENCNKIVYQAESPDEKAFVVIAKSFGYHYSDKHYEFIDFLGEKKLLEILTVEINGNLERFYILEYIEFDSNRKRMSVIVYSEKEDKFKIYSKGSDSTIFPLLSEKSKAKLWKKTIKHVDDFSDKGLRTLICAYKEIPKEEFKKWHNEHQKAKIAPNYEKEYDESVDKIEKNLILLGCTGVEDKLQENVPETINSLKKCGISIWMLTGDNTQTALNIAKSCSLLKPEMWSFPNITILDPEDGIDDEKIFQNTTEKLQQIWQFFQEEKNILNFDKKFGKNFDKNTNFDKNLIKTREKEAERAFAISGKALNTIFPKEKWSSDEKSLKKWQDLLLNVLMHCKVVICCRLSPYQKSQLVKSYRRRTDCLTLAIGDGANDVPMIKEAHVGVGIIGREGLQASRSGDFAIPKFKNLKPLLMYHGANNYMRVFKLINFSFYKNIIIIAVLYGYVLFCGFSATILLPPVSISVRNLIYTHVPIFVMSFMDESYSRETAYTCPFLYKGKTFNENFNFFLVMLQSIISGVAILLIHYFLFDSTTYIGVDGKGLHFCYISYSAFNSLIFVITVQAIFEMEKITIFNLISLIYTVPSYIAIEYIFNVMSKSLNQDNYYCVAEAFSQPVTWMAAFLSVALIAIPQIFIKFLIRYNMPDNLQILREMESSGLKIIPKVKKSSRKITSRRNLNSTVGHSYYYLPKKESKKWTEFMKAKIFRSLIRVK